MQYLQVQASLEAVSLFHAATILWVLSFCMTCGGHYAPDYVQDATHHTILQYPVIIATKNWTANLWIVWRHADGL